MTQRATAHADPLTTPTRKSHQRGTAAAVRGRRGADHEIVQGRRLRELDATSGSEEDEQDGRDSDGDPDRGKSQQEPLAGARFPLVA